MYDDVHDGTIDDKTAKLTIRRRNDNDIVVVDDDDNNNDNTKEK